MKYFFLIFAIFVISNAQNRSSSYPYVTGDTFRAFVDHIIDETTHACRPEHIKKGDVIFLKTDYLAYFFSEIHPHIKDPYILLTHNSDYSVPGNFAYFLDDPKLFAWFGQNTDRVHPKLFPVPIGLANQYWSHGNVNAVNQGVNISHHDSKTIFLYINYSVNTSSKRTDEALVALTRLQCAFVPARKLFEEYVVDLAHSIFVVSPPGNGLDCHRTWESLYLGAIPIVKRSSIESLFADLPVVIVDDWTEITEERLMQIAVEYKNKQFCMSKIYADYWFSVLRNAQENCRKIN